MAEVTVSRKKIKSPSLDDPEREIYQVEYRAGYMPPRFIFIPVKDWTPELEREKIKADMESRDQIKPETLSL